MNDDPDTGTEIRAVIRKFAPADAPAVYAISKLAPEAAQWSPVSYAQAAQSGQAVLVAEGARQFWGFLVSRFVGTEGEILNIAVAPAYRRKGIGSMLLAAAMEEAKTESVERMYLEVRESNLVAISFYQTHSFAKCGQRIGYYSEPTENAILMERKLTA